MPAPAPSRGARKNPACAVCRAKCRKCDRKRPTCGRCVEHGVRCEYPPRFQFHFHHVRQPSSTTDEGSTAVAEEVAEEEEEQQQHEWAVHDASPHDLIYTPSTHDESNTIDETSVASPQDVRMQHVLSLPGTHELLRYFDERVCEDLAIAPPPLANPFRVHVVPLAYTHVGVLEAVLGLTICHTRKSCLPGADLTRMLEHRLSAIQTLSSLFAKNDVGGLSPTEENEMLVTALLLVLHDMCESGISTHGAHLTGVAPYCNTLVARGPAAPHSTTSFVLTALAWLDMLRGFSGAEKLAHHDAVRQATRDTADFTLDILTGCPVRIFRRIGKLLQTGNAFLAEIASRADLVTAADETERFLRAWEPDDELYPTQHPEWRLVAQAWRHVALIRTMRFPDPFEHPCTDDRFRTSVAEILDACARVPRGTTFHKRLLFPLFIAGTETESPHLQDYVRMQLAEIANASAFTQDAMWTILNATWKEREQNTQHWANVPWMEYTCSTLLQRQHDYLFF
ncbi:unnamed protein product [Cercospora beticola]|nr:unnamed protein product [Cercospora beticola]